MQAVTFDVVDMGSRDIIEACFSLPEANREMQKYVARYQRRTYIRRTLRPVGCKEFSDMMSLVRDCRVRREEAYADHLKEVQRKAAQRWEA